MKGMREERWEGSKEMKWEEWKRKDESGAIRGEGEGSDEREEIRKERWEGRNER